MSLTMVEPLAVTPDYESNQGPLGTGWARNPYIGGHSVRTIADNDGIHMECECGNHFSDPERMLEDYFNHLPVFVEDRLSANCRLKPAGDKIIVLPDRDEEVIDEKTGEVLSGVVRRGKEGNILVPKSAVPKFVQGTVVAVGPGKRFVDGVVYPPDIKVGDYVLYSKYGGTDYTDDLGIEYVVLTEELIMSVIQR